MNYQYYMIYIYVIPIISCKVISCEVLMQIGNLVRSNVNIYNIIIYNYYKIVDFILRTKSPNQMRALRMQSLVTYTVERFVFLFFIIL